MYKKTAVKPLSVAVGAAFITSLASAGVATAAENPFGMTELSSGYMVADSHEGKCGGEKKEAEGKSGAEKQAAEGKCGGEKKAAEGKCGEGKCGAKREAHEGKCGGEKKEAEGKCGASK
jgi:uncharacterized low-complexity protein